MKLTDVSNRSKVLLGLAVVLTVLYGVESWRQHETCHPQSLLHGSLHRNGPAPLLLRVQDDSAQPGPNPDDFSFNECDADDPVQQLYRLGPVIVAAAWLVGCGSVVVDFRRLKSRRRRRGSHRRRERKPDELSGTESYESSQTD